MGVTGPQLFEASLFLPRSALVGSRNQEPEVGLRLKHSVWHRHLNQCFNCQTTCLLCECGFMHVLRCGFLTFSFGPGFLSFSCEVEFIDFIENRLASWVASLCFSCLQWLRGCTELQNRTSCVMFGSIIGMRVKNRIWSELHLRKSDLWLTWSSFLVAVVEQQFR